MFTKAHVLFVCKERTSYAYHSGVGKSYGLFNSAAFVANYLNEQGYGAEVVVAKDANSVDKLVSEYDPFIVIIEALWITPEKMHELLKLRRHRDRIWVVRLHSRISFIANEGIAFKWLVGYKNLKSRKLFVAPNVDEFAKDLAEIMGIKSIFLPNIYHPLQHDHAKRADNPDGTIDVGCFGALRPFKNQLSQAVAAVKFAEKNGYKLRFHINATRCEQGGDQVLKNLRSFFDGTVWHHELVEHEWMDHQEFNDVVRKMHIGMQVSFSETFNIVAADFVSNNVPFIGSPQITWLPTTFQADPNYTEDIANCLHKAWHFPGSWMHGLSRRGLRNFNKNSEKIWMDFLEGY